LKRHHARVNVNHYRVFSGRRLERDPHPTERNLILAME
jgi:poly-beta-hydroxyalkanoate depolymerase